MQIFTQLLNDDAGFIVSAELILVSTIAVLALVVGLSEVSFGVNQELEDLGAALGSINQASASTVSAARKPTSRAARSTITKTSATARTTSKA